MRYGAITTIAALFLVGSSGGCAKNPDTDGIFGSGTEGASTAGSEGDDTEDPVAGTDDESDSDGGGDSGPGGSGATPATCGNGVVEGAEECDQNAFGLLTCLTYGFMAGTLVCQDDCTVSTDQCLAETVCGDGVVSGLEECEPGDLQGETCESLSLGEGELGCSADCTFSAAECSCKGKGESCAYNPADPTDPGGCCPAGFKGNEKGICLTIPFSYCE